MLPLKIPYLKLTSRSMPFSIFSIGSATQAPALPGRLVLFIKAHLPCSQVNKWYPSRRNSVKEIDWYAIEITGFFRP